MDDLVDRAGRVAYRRHAKEIGAAPHAAGPRARKVVFIRYALVMAGLLVAKRV